MKKMKWLAIKLVVVIMVVTLGNTREVEAASKYIKVEDYIKYIVDVMNWQIDESSDKLYIEVAMDKGILKEGDFKDYGAYLTRTDAAVIANRLDELLHLKNGYPQDVYKFLKDCTLFEGKLYYDIEGRFFPKRETDQTYEARNFAEDVALSLLGSVFSDDVWVERGLRTRYKDVYNGNKIIKTFIIIGLPSRNQNNVVEIEPFDEDEGIIAAWNIIHDQERKLKAVLEHRISDIKDIPKNKREAVVSIVAKGIIKGYSNGIYVQNREFRGNKKITAKGAQNVIQMVLNPDIRALVSPDGQLIRTSNLPKNAKNYKYILESFPNKYYEMEHSFMHLTDYISGVIGDDEYAYPKEVDYEFLYDNFYYNKMRLTVGKYGYYDQALSNVEKYLEHIFDVDYRTVNDKWKEGLASSLSFYSWQETVYEWIDKYVDNIKKNRAIVELDKIAIDPGAIYESRGYLYVRAYVRYRVTADDMSVPASYLIFGPDTSIENLKKGQWREDIFDVRIESRSEENLHKWGVSAFRPLSDWAYRKSFK